jgi:SAM-dependent methyltransferase
MLVDIKDISEILVSPDDFERLTMIFDETGTMLSCSSSKRSFNIFKGVPVLTVEGSVVDGGSDPASLIDRPSNIRKTISRLVYGSNRVAARNVDKVIDLTKSAAGTNRPKILIVGGGNVADGAEPLYDDPDIDVISFDVYRTAHTNLVADGHQIPLANESVDAVWVQAVLEHVIEPNTVVAEMHRVLKQDGIIYAETPFVQQVHEGRYDFHRFTESGHRWLFRDFEIMSSGVVWGPGTTLQWSVRYFFWALTRSKAIGTAISIPFMVFRWLENLIPEDHMSDGASNLYFMGRKSITALSHEDIVSFYRGAQS